MMTSVWVVCVWGCICEMMQKMRERDRKTRRKKKERNKNEGEVIPEAGRERARNAQTEMGEMGMMKKREKRKMRSGPYVVGGTSFFLTVSHVMNEVIKSSIFRIE